MCKIRSYSLLLLCLIPVCFSETQAVRSRGRQSRIRCQTPDAIPNGSFRLKWGNSVMRVTCKFGYLLQGPRVIDCLNGKWQGERPVCAKRGCRLTLENPEHGLIEYESDYRAVLYCSDDYNLAGNRNAYCNGTHWDREIGNCRERKNTVEHECDFETPDICGWVYEQSEDYEWRRVMAANMFTSYQTGPRHDHTTMTANGGHYMLMESYTDVHIPVPLTSPIYAQELSLKTACCFQFYYFMYGSGVGELSVYVKPVSLNFTEMLSQKDKYQKFYRSGNQNNLWTEAHFNTGEMFEDFQIVIVATPGKNHLSDIAIDDVKLLTGKDCKALDGKSESGEEDTSGEETTTTESLIFDTQSCVSRCFEETGVGMVLRYGKLFGMCNCHIECEETYSCCPDFRAVCFDEKVFAETTTSLAAYTDEVISSSTVNKTTTAKSTTATTTTTMRPTRTTKVSTTTSPKTTTTPTTTTTTTTPKPTTKTTTTTRTTITTPTSTTPKRLTTTTTTARPTTRSTTPTLRTTSTTTTTGSTTKTTKKATTTTATSTATTVKAINWTGNRTANKSSVPPKFRKQNITTWVVEDELYDNRSRSTQTHHGASIMKYLLFLIVAAILVGVTYHRFKGHIAGWYAARKVNGSSDEETSSITAKFCPKSQQNGKSEDEDRPSGTTKSKAKRKAQQTRYKGDMATPLWEEDVFEDDFEGGSIALQNKRSTDL